MSSTIIIDLVRLMVKIDDKDKEIILLCLLSGSHDHLVTSLINKKDNIHLDVIIITLLSHYQRRESVEEGTQGENLYVKGAQDIGRDKGHGDS